MMGRFTSRDPLVASSFYRYTSNNPINRIDPSGFIDWSACRVQGDRGTCTLQTGDTLYQIAREINAAGVSAEVSQLVAELVTLNPQLQNNPNYIRIGETLTVHAAWIAAVQQQNRPAPSAPAPQPEPSQPSAPYPLFLPPPSFSSLYFVVPVHTEASGNFWDVIRRGLSAGAGSTNFMVDLGTDATGYWRGIEVMNPS